MVIVLGIKGGVEQFYVKFVPNRAQGSQVELHCFSKNKRKCMAVVGKIVLQAKLIGNMPKILT